MIFSNWIRSFVAFSFFFIFSSGTAFALTYDTSPNLGLWTTDGTGVDMRVESTNASNPITNNEVRFSVRKKAGATFTQNGVMCLCSARPDGSCVDQGRAAYSTGSNSFAFAVEAINFVDQMTFYAQRSNSTNITGTDTCTNLDANNKSGNILVRVIVATPVINTLTITQSGLGVSGTVQLTSPDSAISLYKLHFSKGSSAGPYNCTRSIPLYQFYLLQSWQVDATNGDDVNTATGATCASVFSGSGNQTMWVKVQAENWAGKVAAVGTASNPLPTVVNWSPSIASVDPLSGVLGQTANITVSGTNLPATMVMDINGQSPVCARQSSSANQVVFSCALSLLGSRTLTVKTDTAANGGTVIGSTRTFTVTQNGLPNITSITPIAARLDVPTTFTVTGTSMTTGMGFAVDDCENVVEIAGGSATSRSWSCTPRAPGEKTAYVKTAPGGAEVGNQIVRVEHPQRLGNAAARGNPSVGGVNLFNGNYFSQTVDLAVPGRGLSFALTRSYNSYDWQYETDHGGVPANKPWRFNIEMKIGFVPNTGNKRLYVAREDGSGESYFLSGGNWYPIDLGNFSKIIVNSGGTYTVQMRGQLSHTFEAPTSAGRILRTNDRDGNQITYAYGGNGKVSTITDSSGRNYTVSYDAYNRINRVEDFTGRFVAYGYTADTTGAKIATFQDVRGGITTYGYLGSGGSNIVSITDPLGNLALSLVYRIERGNLAVKSLTTAVGRAAAGRTCGTSSDFTYCFNYSNLPNSSGFRTSVDGPENLAIASVDFDNAGRAVATTDGQNQTRNTVFTDTSATVDYSKNSLATKQASPLGVAGQYATNIEYDLANGIPTKVTNPELQASNTAWNTNTTANLFTPATVTSALSNTTGIAYTSSGRPNRITAASQYANAGNSTSGASTVLSWSGGVVTAITDPMSNNIAMTRDTHGNLLETTDPRNATWKTTRTYDLLGRVSSTTDARGSVTNFTYDLAGNVLTKTQLITGLPNIVNTYIYDLNGNLTTHTDGRGTTTTHTYDIGNRLRTVSRVVSGLTTTQTLNYDNASRLNSVTNENSNTATRAFDAAGRVTGETLLLSRTTSYTYDADNRLKTTTDPQGRVTTYSYDRVGRMTSVTNLLGQTTRYEYDGEGRMAAMFDEKSQKTSYGYDRNGNLTQVTDANGVASSTSYDNANRMISRSDPRGKTTYYIYDAAGNMTSQTDPLGKVWQYTYDQNNNLLSVQTPDNRTTQYQYDTLNRRTKTTYNNTTTVTYAYDGNSNLTSMVDNVGTTLYQYDEANRLKQLTDPFGNILSYTYDKAGNRTGTTYPGARTVVYGFDAAERMSTARDWGNRTATYTYNLSDQVTRLVHGNASSADYTYDIAGRLTSLINKRPNGTVISSHAHTLDQHGNITQADEILPLQPTLTPRTKRWSVDEANRVLSDAVSGDSFEHDTAGRMIRQVMNGVTTNFTYNDLDLLTDLSAPGRTETYRYNGHGHRIERTVNSVATRYLVEPNGTMPNMLAELSNSNNPQRFYVHGANGLLSQIDAAGTYHAYHFAPIGNTTALTDAAGNVSDTYAYLPYGETFAGAGNVTTNPFKFVGRFGVMDEGNGLQYMRARYYKPDVGRFMSLDAIAGNSEEPQSLNRSAYALGNPLRGIDPSGLTSMVEEIDYNDEGIHLSPAVKQYLKNVAKEAYATVIDQPATELRSCVSNLNTELAKTNTESQYRLVGAVGTVACAGNVATAALSVQVNIIKGEVNAITTSAVQSNVITQEQKKNTDIGTNLVIDVGTTAMGFQGIPKNAKSVIQIIKPIIKKPTKVKSYVKTTKNFVQALSQDDFKGLEALQSIEASFVPFIFGSEK